LTGRIEILLNNPIPDGKLPRAGRFCNHWNKDGPPSVYRSMATAVLLLTVFVGAMAVRILGVSSIDLLDDRKPLDEDVR
jgi:hypothetical protein